MVDTSMVGIRAFYEAHGCIVSGKPTRSREGFEYSCSCPLCNGRDRASFWESGRFCCIRGCRAHCSSPYWFLRDIEGQDHVAACEELGIDPGSEYVQARPKIEYKHIFAPNDTWQSQASAVIHIAQKHLRGTTAGLKALEYLYERGLTDETIEAARLGYIPTGADGRWLKQSKEKWGLDIGAYEDKECVWLYEGLLIPWFEGDTLWKLNVRRLNGLKENDPKYLEILGSGEGLYNVDSIQSNLPVVLVESELDALSGQQTCSDLAAFVATGSASRARVIHWESRLCLADRVLVAYDDDKNQAGDKGARYWLNTLPHAAQALPWGHDLNEMLVKGKDLRAWLQVSIDIADLQSIEEEPPIQIEDTLPIVNGSSPASEALTSAVLETCDSQQSEPLGYEGGDVCFQCGQQVCYDEGRYYIEEDRASKYWGEVFCMLCRQKQIASTSPAIVAQVEQTANDFIVQIHKIFDPVDIPGGYTLQGPVPVGTLRLEPPKSCEPALSDRICPHCLAAGRRSKGGARTIGTIVKKIAGGPFHYMWNETRQFWMCPKCLDIQVSMPADKSRVFVLEESEPELLGPPIDPALEPEAIRIAEAEHLPLTQARYWARVNATHEANGFHKRYAEDQARIRARVAAIRAEWFGEVN